MTQLPAAFTDYTRQLMGDERFERYLQSFEEEPPVSIRLNPKKVEGEKWKVEDGEPVPWCRNAFYLKSRPSFTMDPLFHAGCYYVQEAASMFLDEVLRQQMVNSKPSNCKSSNSKPSNSKSSNSKSSNSKSSNSKYLDLCAAPGGKSTLLRSALPADYVLYSNEPIRNRASILLENVTKWGYDNHLVTSVYPKVYRRSKLCFDVILCDVPCSGEGMFRKDPATIHEWSPQNVEKCWQLQRDIVADAWPCLNPGGLLIYSTCTFNTKENEENIRWILDEFDDAEVVPLDVQPEWNITGSLLPGFQEPVYRFIPGISRGEGLFMCVLRKKGEGILPPEGRSLSRHEVRGKKNDLRQAQDLNILSAPASPSASPRVNLSYPQAMAYLRHEALVLPADTPRGIVEVCFMGHPLGLAKNIGNRANNLYPKEWKIKTTHIPNDYEAILRHT